MRSPESERVNIFRPGVIDPHSGDTPPTAFPRKLSALRTEVSGPR